MNEKAYNTMKHTGAGCIAIGIVLIVMGLGAGVLSIINGAKLLSNKHNITF